MLRATTLLSLLLTLPNALHAQEGDRNNETQRPPLSPEQIPPSPLLTDQQALQSFQIAEDFQIELVANHNHVDKAIALSFDADGNIWTVEMRSYMNDLDGTDEGNQTGRIRILQDTDNDGRIDHSQIFLDNLTLPRALAVTSDGLLYTDGQALHFIARQGFTPTGEPTIIDPDYAQGGNPEHKANGLLLALDNWYYNAKHNRRYRRINGQWISQATASRGQWGITQDNYGRLYYNTNSTLLIGEQMPPNFYRGQGQRSPEYDMAQRLGPNSVYPIRVTPGANRAYQHRFLRADGSLRNATSASGPVIYRGNHFPAIHQGRAFVNEAVGDLVKTIHIQRDNQNNPSGSHPLGQREFLASTDEWFTPVSLYNAPDGSLYLIDMVHGLIQHKTYMTSYLRDQYTSRNLHQAPPAHGRIYRIRHSQSPLSPVATLSQTPIQQLPALLLQENGQLRDTAQRLIVESQNPQLAPILRGLLQQSPQLSGPSVLHLLYSLEGLQQLQAEDILQALQNPDPEAQLVILHIASLQPFPQNAPYLQALSQHPTSPRTQLAHLKALAANGHPQATQLVHQHIDQAGSREAYLSGLGLGNQTVPLSSITDPTLKAQIQQLEHTQAAIDRSQLSPSLRASIARGEDHYINSMACAGCHGLQGEGTANMAPPLDHSEWVTGDPNRLARILFAGLQGPLTVNGTHYQSPDIMPLMPGFAARPDITDQQMADVINYVRNSWNNQTGDQITADQVSQARATVAQRGATPYTASELQPEPNPEPNPATNAPHQTNTNP